MRKLYLIGGGMGNPGLLTSESLTFLNKCDIVYAFDRLAQLNEALHQNIQKCTYTELVPMLEQSTAETIGVLVSGDTGFFSVAKLLNEKLGDIFNVIVTCGVNSLQYLCSKLKISYENIPVVSLHGRNRSILGNLAYNRYTFVLSGSDHNASDILKELEAQGLGHIRVTVGEFLSMEQERILTGTIHDIASYEFDNLSVLLFENDQPVQKERPLFDEELIRDKTPMTKQEVRWASIQYLELLPEEVVYDIGAGTGSVSIEMAKKVYNGVVYAMEKEEESYELLNRNKEKLGAYNLITKHGRAMELMNQLPTPDKAFIGGSGKELEQIMDYLFQVNPQIKLVINAITLETLSSAMSLCEKHNCAVQVSCMNISRNKTVGDYNLMMANNPVYIMVVKKR